jgi:bacillithiol biosynthesis cysteine-adding enzyme BshC
MNFEAQYFHYRQTGAFFKLVIDYIEDAAALRSFYNFRPDIEGIKRAITARNEYTINRKVLVQQLENQYAGIETTTKVTDNITSLLLKNTYTVCTAHQPNIFTGHLYFIYKIIHVIKLADQLNNEVSDAHFVPVFYMGSEDADLEELGEVRLNGKKYKWETIQKGAVGRMKVDESFMALAKQIEGQLLVEPFGKEIMAIVNRCYIPGKSIEQATLELINILFAEYGLVVLLPDNPALKNEFIHVAERELLDQFSDKAVAETITSFPKEYKVQASGRVLNLFYLEDDKRERIELSANGFIVTNTSLSFSREEMLEELKIHPERFSPNVILRPLYQEMILPNIAFIGGGGELAYWLELKNVFEKSAIPFPVLVLRNSFMFLNKKVSDKIKSLGFSSLDMFKPEPQLVKMLVERETDVKLHLGEESSEIKAVYNKLTTVASDVDPTLKQHVEALSVKALHRLELLEKKMLSAEKKKFEAQLRHIKKLKLILFPGETLQERVDNFLPYYALWGPAFIDAVYKYSTGLKQEFCVIEELK